MDITVVYIAWGIAAFMGLFYLIATIRVIWLLQDIRMELRMQNDNSIDKVSPSEMAHEG
jgi:hypothetical protein